MGYRVLKLYPMPVVTIIFSVIAITWTSIFMKSKHLARADFLRELKVLVHNLYGLGDFTSVDPARKLLEAKVNGFIQGGLLIEVVSTKEVQAVINDCHIACFGESKDERKTRLIKQGAISGSVEDADSADHWDHFDSPARDRLGHKSKHRQG